MVSASTITGNWKVTSAPASEPVTTAELKSHCRVEVSDDDTLIASYGAAAREWVERTGIWRSLVTQTITLKLDEFPCSDDPILLPQPPLISVTSITYVDTNGTTQTWSSSEYRVDTYAEPGRVTPAYGYSYPSTRDVTGAVTVVYSAGYGTASDVPNSIKTAIKFLAANWYENREPVVLGTIAPQVPWTILALLEPYNAKGFV